MTANREVDESIFIHKDGATVIEFCLIMPVMLMMIFGLGDALYRLYAQMVLSGAIQKAARNSAIQGGAQESSKIDDDVISMIGSIMIKPSPSCAINPLSGTYCITRSHYVNFSSSGSESFNDDNLNGRRDPGECFVDDNKNGTWDNAPSPGAPGQGGAGDVAIYRISITFERLFPLAGLMGLSPQQTIAAQTVLKNQPYAGQVDTEVTTICS